MNGQPSRGGREEEHDILEDVYVIYANATLYAVWESTITFYPNGGDENAFTMTGAISETIQLPSEGFTRTGYTLIGWSTQQTGAAEYELGGNYDITGNATLYAVWEEVTPQS